MAHEEMSTSKEIRLFTLLILLSAGSLPRTRAEIFDKMSAFYRGSIEARERMFERDKRALREIGIDLQTFENPDNGDLVGYRVDVSQSQEHRVSFTAEESVVVGIAARLLAGASDAQLIAQTALGVDALAEGMTGHWLSEVLKPAPLPPFMHDLANAIRRRQRIEFAYAKPGHTADVRCVNPWVVVARTGRWYLIAEETATGLAKIFRVDRMRGSLVVDDTEDAFTVPPNLDIAAFLSGPGEDSESPKLLVRPGTCLRVRRLSLSTEPFSEEWDCCILPDMNEERVARLVAEHAGDIRVLSPEPLVARVQAMLNKVVAPDVN